MGFREGRDLPGSHSQEVVEPSSYRDAARIHSVHPGQMTLPLCASVSALIKREYRDLPAYFGEWRALPTVSPSPSLNMLSSCLECSSPILTLLTSPLSLNSYLFFFFNTIFFYPSLRLDSSIILERCPLILLWTLRTNSFVTGITMIDSLPPCAYLINMRPWLTRLCAHGGQAPLLVCAHCHLSHTDGPRSIAG